MKKMRIKAFKMKTSNKRHISAVLLILAMVFSLCVPVILLLRTAAAPVLTQKIVLRDAEKAQRENVTVNRGETLSSCYIEVTPANVTNQSVTLTSSNPSIMTVAQHKGTDGHIYADITGVNSGVATLTVTAQDTGKTYSLSVSVAIPLESAEAELRRALNPKKTAQDTAASFTTTCSAGQRGTVVGEVGDYYFFDIPKGVLEKNYHAAYVKKSDLLIYANAVTLAPSTVILNKGQKQKLTAAVTPGYATEKTVQYSTSNGAIASVSKSGNIKAKKKGTVTITATVASKSNGQVINRTATVGVTVKQPVKKITIKPSRLTIEKGKTKKLNVIKSPANADDALITYQSSNETVATVSQTGSITAKKEGTAVITVENKASGKKKTCKITVTDTHSYELIVDEELTVGKTYQAQVVKKTALKKQTVSRESPPKNLYYKSSNPKVIKVDRKTGKVTPLKQGSVTISFINQETRESVGKKVSSIQLTKKELTKLATEERFLILKEKQTAYLFGKGYNNREMSISSDDEKTATVTKSGKVTAITAGSCTITTKLRYKTITTTVFVYRPALQYGITQKTLTLYQKKGIGSVQSMLDNDRNLNIKGRIGKEFYYVEILNKQGKIIGTGLTGQKDILTYSRRANRDYVSKMKKGDWKYLHYSNTVGRDKTDHAPIQMVLVDDTVHIYVNFQYKGKAENKFITYDKKGTIVKHKKTYRQVFENGIKKYWGNRGKTVFTGGSKYFTMDLGALMKNQYYHEKDFAEGVRLKCNVHINEKLGKLDERIPVYIGSQNKSSEDNTYWFWVTDKNISYKIIKGYSYRLYKPNSENWYMNIPTNEQLWSNKVNAMKMGKKTGRGNHTKEDYEKVCSHEFGHLLGLNDAYDLKDEHLGTTTISRRTISMVEKYYKWGLIMDDEYNPNFIGIRENDLEMILYSYNYSKYAANEYSWQSYRSYQTEWNKCGYIRSNAITWKLEKKVIR